MSPSTSRRSTGPPTAGSDYDLSAGTVDFAAGQTTASVAVTVTGDEDAEGDETFDVDLANPVNATLGTHPAVVTIQDNDPIPPGSAVLNVTRRTVREGSGGTRTLVFTVTRSGETDDGRERRLPDDQRHRDRALGLHERLREPVLRGVCHHGDGPVQIKTDRGWSTANGSS